MTPARFPIISGSREGDRQREIFGKSVPWKVVEHLEADAQCEHGQSLERLAERGGLSWGELATLFVRHRAVELKLLAPYRHASEIIKPKATAGEKS